METRKSSFNVASAHREMHILRLLLEVNKDYTELKSLDIKTRTLREISDRIANGVRKPADRDKLQKIKQELATVILGYFSKNDTPRCPLHLYLPILKNGAIPMGDFFRMVALNDGALYRWEKKLGEWEGFTPSGTVNRINFLLKNITEAIKEKSEDKKSSIDMFDGSL